MYLSRLLVAIFVLGLLGTAGELLLLGHFEDIPQFIPLVLLGVALMVLPWYVMRPSRASLQAFRAILAVFIISGILGLYLHYRGNVEFERERDSSLAGLPLFWEAITGATPALAPGGMILLAFIGFALTISYGPKDARPEAQARSSSTT